MSKNKGFEPSIQPPGREQVLLKGTDFNPGAANILGASGASPNRIRASNDGTLVVTRLDGTSATYPSNILGSDIIGGGYQTVEAGTTCSTVVVSWNT